MQPDEELFDDEQPEKETVSETEREMRDLGMVFGPALNEEPVEQVIKRVMPDLEAEIARLKKLPPITDQEERLKKLGGSYEETRKAEAGKTYVTDLNQATKTATFDAVRPNSTPPSIEELKTLRKRYEPPPIKQGQPLNTYGQPVGERGEVLMPPCTTEVPCPKPTPGAFTVTLALHTALEGRLAGNGLTVGKQIFDAIKDLIDAGGLGMCESFYRAAGELVIITHGWDAEALKAAIRASAGPLRGSCYFRQTIVQPDGNRFSTVVQYVG